MEIIGNAVIQKDGTLILPQEIIQRLELKFGDELDVYKRQELTIGAVFYRWLVILCTGWLFL